mgnify:CR=1 FL=1
MKQDNKNVTPLFSSQKSPTPNLAPIKEEHEPISDSESEENDFRMYNRSKEANFFGLSPTPISRVSEAADIIESSDEEDSSLFAPSVMGEMEDIGDFSPRSSPVTPKQLLPDSPKKRWLDSVRTPNKDTQGGAGTPMRKRRGVEVSRLHKLIEAKKTEEMAAKHIIATRQVNNIPDSNSRVVIKAGRVIGTLYKTFCVSVDPHCQIREVRAIFSTEKKMEHGLAPGVTLNLIPPW